MSALASLPSGQGGVPLDDTVTLHGAFCLRVFHNHGAPIFDWRLIDLPAGMQIAANILPDGHGPGCATIFIKCGAVNRFSFVAKTEPGVTKPSGIIDAHLRPWFAGETNGANYRVPVDNQIKDLAGAATPSLPLSIGDPIVILTHEPVYSKNVDTVNGTVVDGFLEDLEIHAALTFQYKGPVSFE